MDIDLVSIFRLPPEGSEEDNAIAGVLTRRNPSYCQTGDKGTQLPRFTEHPVDLTAVKIAVTSCRLAVAAAPPLLHPGPKIDTPPLISVRPVELTVEEGQDAVFSCGVVGRPSPTIFWLVEVNHTLILPGSENGRFVSSEEEGYVTLTVKQVKREDDGLVVMCGAVNSVGSDSWFSRLTVSTPADHPPPIIQLGPANQTLPLHTPATLLCKASGQPSPVVSWYKDGVPVKTDPPMISISDDGTLTIKDLVKSDEGLYTCVASSPAGKATWSASLRLEPRTNPNAAFFRSPEPATLPGPPSTPVLVDSTDSSITISWTRNNKIGASSLLGYQVEMFSRSLTGGWLVVARRVAGPTYTQNYLQSNASYKFVVRAENSHGLSSASPPSATLSLMTSHTREDAGVQEARASLSTGHVVNLKSVQPVSSTSVKVTWEILSGDHVEGVLIYSQDKNTTSSVSVLHSRDSSSYLVTGLQPYTQYQFFLIPFYKTVAGRPSNSATAVTLEDVPSEPPSHLQAVLVSKRSVQLKWKPPTYGQNGIITSYQVMVRVGNSVNNVTVSAANPSLLLTNLTVGIVYTVQAAAATTVGVGPYSNPRSLRLDPTAAVSGHFGQPINMQPSLDMTEPDVLSESWFTALLGSMVTVMFLFFSAMFYVWRKQMINDKGYQQDAQRNSEVLGFRVIPPPLSDLWIDQHKSEAKDCAEINGQSYDDTSAAYAYTTLVPPSANRSVDCNKGTYYGPSYTSFGYYGRKIYCDNYNYNCLSNKEYSKLIGNSSPMVTHVTEQGGTQMETEREAMKNIQPSKPSLLPRFYPTVNSTLLTSIPGRSRQQDKIYTEIGIERNSIYYPQTRKLSTFSCQTQIHCNQNHNTNIYHSSTGEPPRLT
ncbi:protein sax-3-like [Macrosteles quadrilineatus]|uniref:protein sax-3-like n=1 Tax=Macrosteles quadrilineatus TaxID=74068 RepID=UPI0023E0F6FC|nr:protein sax-3-like [Macrosteles quadrilineatus]